MRGRQSSAPCAACKLEAHRALEHRQEVHRQGVRERHAEKQHGRDGIQRSVVPLALAPLRILLLLWEQPQEAERGEGEGVRERERARHRAAEGGRVGDVVGGVGERRAWARVRPQRQQLRPGRNLSLSSGFCAAQRPEPEGAAQPAAWRTRHRRPGERSELRHSGGTATTALTIDLPRGGRARKAGCRWRVPPGCPGWPWW